MATHTIYDKTGNIISVIQLPEQEPTEEQQMLAETQEALAILAAEILNLGGNNV